MYICYRQGVENNIMAKSFYKIPKKLVTMLFNHLKLFKKLIDLSSNHTEKCS